MAIEVRNIVKRFGSFAALDNVDLKVADGELLALLGPSGSGKTTLLRIIAGLDWPDSGEVAIDGENALSRGASERQVGFVFQHYALFRHMTVFENVAFGLRVQPRAIRKDEATIRARVKNLLDLVQLDWLANRYPSQLSGGQRQRIALARALAIEPRILLLDEPFGALDAKVRKELRQWLRSLHSEIHVTSIFVTHDQEEALVMSDRIAVMFEGEIAQLDGPEALYARPASRRVADFIGVMNFLPATILSEMGGTVTVDVAGLGTVELPERQVSRANPDDAGAVIGFRPETMTLVGPGATHTQPRETNATIDEVVYYGDMTYYDLRLDGAAAIDGKAHTVRISMRNVFGRDVQEVGTRTRLAWSPGSLVLFR